MIRLHRHSDAGARMGADSPELTVPPEEDRLSPPGAPCVFPAAPAPVGATTLMGSWEGVGSAEEVGSDEEAESEPVEEAAALAVALVCKSAFTETK